jgi:hypothetical protein
MLARCRALYRDALLERLNAGPQRRAAGTQVSALNEPGRTFFGTAARDASRGILERPFTRKSRLWCNEFYSVAEPSACLLLCASGLGSSAERPDREL